MKTTNSSKEKEIRDLKNEITKLKKSLTLKSKELEKVNSQLHKNKTNYTSNEISAQHYIDIAGVMIVILNLKGILVKVNKMTCKVLGYSESELLGKNWFDNFVPEDQKKAVKKVFNTIIKGKLEHVEYYDNEIITKSGQVRIISWHNSTVYSKDGDIIGLLSSGEDITEKKLYEIELSLSQERLKTLSDASFEAIFISDKGICLDQNRTAETMFGYTREEAIGEMGTQWIVPEDRETVLTNMMKNVTEPYKVTALRKDGSTFPCEIQARVLSIDGKALRFTALRDISDREDAENRIKQSEQKYSSLFTNIQEGVALHEMIFDKKGNPTDFVWIDVNPKYEEITQLKKEDIIGKRGRDIIPSIEQKWLDAYGEVVKTGKSVTIIDHSEYLDKYWEVKAFRPSAGMFAVSMVDITNRKKAEIERDRIFNFSVDMLCTATFDGYLKLLNPAWEKNLGWTPEELRTKPFLEFIHPDDVQPTIDAASGISSGEKMLGFENRYRTKDGSYRWLSWNTIPIPGEKIMLGIARDISEQKEHRKVLIETKDRLEKALKIGNAGVYQWDLTSNNMEMSDELMDIFGYKKEDGVPEMDIEGKNVYPDDVELLKDTIAKAIKTGEPFQLEYRFYNADTMELRWAHVEASVEFTDDKPTSIIGLVQDITDIKNVENELILAKEKAEESDQLKSAFLANMSHEIRTPMNGILGFTELLREPSLSGEKREKYIDIIRKSGNRMLSTVNDIIEISKIETGQINITENEINVDDMLTDHYNFFKPETEEKSFDLVLKSNIKAESPIVITDRAMLDSILTNLIKNAIKYTKKGRIEFGVDYMDDCIELYVKDSGIGIAKNRHDAIFDRFTQADIEDKQAFEGSGLGLSIVKAYVEMLRGKITLDSQLGKGSIFRACIPVKYVNLEIISGRNELLGGETEDKKIKALIVEDDGISELHMSILLKDICKEIVIARTGLDAVKICQERTDINLILMDIKIPGINGYEATKRIRKFNKSVKIIAQTAYAMPDDRENAKKVGCDEYITKPIIKEKLMDIIDSMF